MLGATSLHQCTAGHWTQSYDLSRARALSFHDSLPYLYNGHASAFLPFGKYCKLLWNEKLCVRVCVRTCFLFLVGFKDLQICITISQVLLAAEYKQDGALPPCRKSLPPATQQVNCITFTSISSVTVHSQKSFDFWGECLGSSRSM